MLTMSLSTLVINKSKKRNKKIELIRNVWTKKVYQLLLVNYHRLIKVKSAETSDCNFAPECTFSPKTAKSKWVKMILAALPHLEDVSCYFKYSLIRIRQWLIKSE